MGRLKAWWRRRRKTLALLAIALLVLYAWARWAPMAPLFAAPRSTVLLARDGTLLGATVATDGQWRFPVAGDVPERFATCLIQFEDREFRSHWGVRPQSLVRAFLQNRRAGRTVSGGSTLTMQVARMSRGNQQRTYASKIVESLLALRLETRMSKQEILSAYAANAPFGGNVVGLDAAAWRWYGRSPDRLTWSECATLAVLPNAPSAIYPGKGQQSLRAKRDRLLNRLLTIGAIDRTERDLALQEPLPGSPHPLPQLAPHLLTTLIAQGHAGQVNTSTLDAHLQERVTAACERQANRLQANEVHNAAALIIHVPSGEVRAYIGNLASAGAEHGRQVDVIRAKRSTGSLLKPFLYADMLQSGERTPEMLVADIPTRYNGFAPRNFDEHYAGAVPASEALARSLNVPAVRALREHGVERMLHTLRAMGLHGIDRPADHYGLSLIVGGADCSLWELGGAYASMARVLNEYGRGGQAYHAESVRPPHVLLADSALIHRQKSDASPLSASSIFTTMTALREVKRPDDEAGWRSFTDQERISWKTGTSFGHRDAWAIGVSDRWCVAVWTGNASGEGRPGLTGTLVAAPLLFDLFRMLPRGHGFDAPFDEMTQAPICPQSGHLASHDCTTVDTLWVPKPCLRTKVCPYHLPVVLDATGKKRVPLGEGTSRILFNLPPAMERYYAHAHPDYLPPPPSTSSSDASTVMQVLYPDAGARLILPTELDGSRGKAVFEVAHRNLNAKVHWDLDGRFIGSTQGDHVRALDPGDGVHTLTFTDEQGNRLSHSFVVVGPGQQ